MLKSIFSAPHFDQPDDQRLANNLNVILLVLLAAVSAALVTDYLEEPYIHGYLIAIGLADVFLIALYIIFRRKNLIIPSYGAPLTIHLLVTYTLLGEGLTDIPVMAFAGCVAMGALLIGKRGPLIFAGLTILSGLGIYLAHAFELWPVPAGQATEFGDFVFLAIIILAVGFITRLLITNLLETIARLRASEATTREANALLEVSLEKLRDLNENLEKLVEERTKELRVAKEEAETARDRAEQADRVKSQFLASMSHELRTPLNAILNFTEMTAMGMVGPVNDQQKDILTKSLDSGKHLLDLINDVLDVTKMQSGMLSLFLEENINLKPEIDQVISTIESLLRNKQVMLVTSIEPDLPMLVADKRRIRQVLINLLSNAAKFTEDGSITLTVKRHDGGVMFSVKDTGPGIKDADRAIIFEPFIQTEAGIKHQGGTGLGLPISRWLAEAHGGKLWVESAPGQGATFYFSLPLKAAVRPPEKVS
jgi:signal transduction histidine kinase